MTRTCSTPVLTALFLASVTLADDAASKRWSIADGSPPQLQTVINARGNREAREWSMNIATDAVKDAQAALKDAKAHNEAKSDEVVQATAKLAKAKARVAGLRSGKSLPWPPFSSNELKVGLAGFWKCASVYKVFQVIDKNAAILELQDSGLPLVWVENLGTDGVTDGQEIYATKLALVITGTKTYDTALGTKTVWVARTISDDDFVYHG